MYIKIFNHEYSALLDTGASVSAMSEVFFKFLQKNFPKQNLPMLPTTGITVSTALLGKNKKIHSQTFLEIDTHSVKSNAIFLIVPSLSTQLILWNDWLTDNKIIINYNDKIISSPVWNDCLNIIIKSDNINPHIDTILDNMFLNDEYNHVVNDTSLSYPLDY